MKYLSLAAAALLATAPVIAQDDDGGNLTQIFWFDIKHGHGDEFSTGMEAYWSCVKENGGTRAWSAWRPTTGNLNGIMFRSGGHEWSAFDEESPVGDACDEAWEVGVLPHTSDVYSGMVAMTEYTHVAEGLDVEVVMEIYFDFHNVNKGMEMVAKMDEAFEGKEWYNYEWFNIISGPRSWDASVAILSEDYAGMSPRDQDFWDIQAEHFGKKEAEKMRTAWNENIRDSRTRMYSRARKVSYNPDAES